MKRTAVVSALAVLALVFLLTPHSADSASKEILQLQRDVALLQNQVNDLRKSVDRGNAVLRTLIEQSADTINRMTETVEGLDQSVRDTVAGSGARVDSLVTQVRALRDSVDEMGARFGRVSQQLTETRSVLQSVDGRLATLSMSSASSTSPASSTGPAGTVGANGQPPAPPSKSPTSLPSSAPSADTLYDSGLRDFNAGNYDLAEQQFKDYLKYYGTSELGGNAQYYLGEIEYQRGRYQSAIAEYDKVLQSFPNSYKMAASYLKKGYALLELNERRDAVELLRMVVEKFPQWDEAKLARSRLRRLGENVPD